MSRFQRVTITVDGSSLRNGYPDASGGWGAVVEVGGATIEVRQALCKVCNSGMQTNNRAELRAAQWALHLMHELAKMGHAVDHCKALSDARPIDASALAAVLRTDSEYVVRGLSGRNRVVKHVAVWEEMFSTRRCVEKAGLSLQVAHVRGHSGDRANARADLLAREAAAEGMAGDYAYCDICEVVFEGGALVEVATHIKEEHLEWEHPNPSEVAAIIEELSVDGYPCKTCNKRFGSSKALAQHTRDKHFQ